MTKIIIGQTADGLKINNRLYLGYSRWAALKRYRAANGLTGKHCEIIDAAKIDGKKYLFY